MRYIKQKIKNTELIKHILNIIGIFKKLTMFLCNKMIGINDKKVIFISFSGKSYSDNPKAISEKLHEMYPDFEIVWIFNSPEEKRKIVPDYVKCVKVNSLRALKELATAKFWVDNFCKPIYMYKSKDQIYIQTWHGERGFKKILYDSPFITRDTKFIESESCNLILSGSDFADRIYRTSLHYNGRILKCGCPKNDILIENSKKKVKELRRKLKINENNKIVLFAPTLRREAAKKNILQPTLGIDWNEILKALEDKMNNDWLFLFRAHSAIKDLSGMPEDKRFMNVSSYEDMADLLLISDILITDYSSSAGDFALLHRPVILFQNDREEFIKKDRPFYFDIDKSPYMVAKNQVELISIINRFDDDLIYKNCEDILDFYGTKESGKATENVIKYIISKM